MNVARPVARVIIGVTRNWSRNVSALEPRRRSQRRPPHQQRRLPRLLRRPHHRRRQRHPPRRLLRPRPRVEVRPARLRPHRLQRLSTPSPTSPSKPPKAKRSSSSPTPATHRRTSPCATRAKPSPHRWAPARSAPMSGKGQRIAIELGRLTSRRDGVPRMAPRHVGRFFSNLSLVAASIRRASPTDTSSPSLSLPCHSIAHAQTPQQIIQQVVDTERAENKTRPLAVDLSRPLRQAQSAASPVGRHHSARRRRPHPGKGRPRAARARAAEPNPEIPAATPTRRTSRSPRTRTTTSRSMTCSAPARRLPLDCRPHHP